MKIPVRNLYLLLSYAWDALDLADLVEVGVEDSAEPRDLLAHVFLCGCNHVLRRGVDRQYVEAREETSFPHGRVDFRGSLPLLSKRSGRLAVEYEELSAD